MRTAPTVNSLTQHSACAVVERLPEPYRNPKHHAAVKRPDQHVQSARARVKSRVVCKVRGSSSMLLLGCLGDLLRFEKREIQVATFAPDRSSP